MKRLLVVATVLVAGIIIQSCSQREENKLILKNEDVSKQVKLSGRQISLMNSRPRPAGQVNIGIFEVTFHRASRGCTSGFGFCDFEWFPSTPMPPMPPMPSFPKEGGQKVYVYKEKESYFFEVYVSEELPSNISTSDLDLIVDNDLTTSVNLENENLQLTIQKGNYKYDSQIGNYGGYKINLQNN